MTNSVNCDHKGSLELEKYNFILEKLIRFISFVYLSRTNMLKNIPFVLIKLPSLVRIFKKILLKLN